METGVYTITNVITDSTSGGFKWKYKEL